MKTAYCPHCNHKHSYQLVAPKFCSDCGESMTSFKKKSESETPKKKIVETSQIISKQKERTVILKRQPSFARASLVENNDDYEEDEDGEIQETDVVELPEIDDDFADSFQLSCSFAGRRIGSLKVDNGKIVNA